MQYFIIMANYTKVNSIKIKKMVQVNNYTQTTPIISVNSNKIRDKVKVDSNGTMVKVMMDNG